MPQQQRHTESSILQSYLLTPSALPTILPYSSFLQLVPTQHRSHPHLKRLYRDLQFQRTIDVDTVRQNIAREVSRSAVLKARLARAVDAELYGKSVTDESQKRKRKRGADEEQENDHQSNRSSHNSDDDNEHDEFTDPQNLAIDTTYLTSSLHPAHTGDSTSNPNHPLTSATRTHHTPSTLLSALDSACSTLQTEISDLETESARLTTEMNEIVGALSDLRYGRFARPVSGDSAGEDRTVEDEILEALEGLERKLEGIVGQT